MVHGHLQGREMKPMVHSRCVQTQVSDITGRSLTLLSTKSPSGEIPLVLIPAPRSSFSFMLSVPTGVYCMMQRFGKDIGRADPGLHMLPPYYRIAYVVSAQSCTYDAPVRACPTSDDVRVHIDVVVIFQIFEPHDFIYKLGAKNFDEFLSGTIDEAVRMLVRKEDHMSVYTLRGETADTMLQILNHKFTECGVRFSDVKVTSIWLPESLHRSLEMTTKMEKAMDKLERENEFEILRIKQESEMQIEEIRRKGEQVLVSESGRKKRAELEFEQKSVKAEEEGKIALIEAESKVEVMLLETKTQLERTKMQLETWRISETANADAAANTVKVEAELKAEEMIIEGKWQEEKMVCDAEATKHEAGAESEASKCLAAKRQHELDLREKQILMKLAEQGNFNLIGSAGDKIINAMMTGSLQT
mmetsp:Transcript_34254/g.102359  ORF Transcript_34254/g.102359 Transcript_34254/m.102359 type:complete len:417 (-) Transcript_34254:242-1492(-)